MRHLLFAVICSGAALAELPNEDDLFIKPVESKALIAAPTESNAFQSGKVKENPLQVGGVYYQEFDFSWQNRVAAKNAPVNMPLTFDGFLDSRPNDRLRGFIDWRLNFDAGLDANSQTENSSMQSLGTTLSNGQTRPNPSLSLDQAWIKFDIDHRVFMTVGKQHVKWGTGHYWNPTDFLSSSKKDPFAAIDERLGVTMIKANIPLEPATLYVIAVFDQASQADEVRKIAGAIRYEHLVWIAELGFDLVTRLGSQPAFGVDLSLPIGPLDFYLESAYYKSSDPHYIITGSLAQNEDIANLYRVTHEEKPSASTTIGSTVSFPWRENRLATLGTEYFHNSHGYANGDVYPLLIFENAFQPFNLGRDYAACYLSAEGPDAQKKTTYQLTWISNLTDKSMLARFDFTLIALSDLTFTTFFAKHYGTRGSEFHFAVDTPALQANGQSIPPIKIYEDEADLGIGFRLAF